MKILIDTNIVLDLILEREPFVESAIALFEQAEKYLKKFLTPSIRMINLKSQIDRGNLRKFTRSCHFFSSAGGSGWLILES